MKDFMKIFEQILYACVDAVKDYVQWLTERAWPQARGLVRSSGIVREDSVWLWRHIRPLLVRAGRIVREDGQWVTQHVRPLTQRGAQIVREDAAWTARHAHTWITADTKRMYIILFLCAFVCGAGAKMIARETMLIGHHDYLLVPDAATARVTDTLMTDE